MSLILIQYCMVQSNFSLCLSVTSHSNSEKFLPPAIHYLMLSFGENAGRLTLLHCWWECWYTSFVEGS